MSPMTDLKRTQLINLGAEQLADILLELSDSYSAVSDVVKRLLSTPDENIKRYKMKMIVLVSVIVCLNAQENIYLKRPFAP